MSLLTIFTSVPELQVDYVTAGTVNDSTVVVAFKYPVIAEDYGNGFTIKVAGSNATISSATRQSNHRLVYFVLSAPIAGGETIEVVYDASAGTYSKEDLTIDFDVTGGVNLIGSNLWFNVDTNSGQIVTLGL